LSNITATVARVSHLSEYFLIKMAAEQTKRKEIKQTLNIESLDKEQILHLRRGQVIEGS
jgi:hypothetical protein